MRGSEDYSGTETETDEGSDFESADTIHLEEQRRARSRAASRASRRGSRESRVSRVSRRGHSRAGSRVSRVSRRRRSDSSGSSSGSSSGIGGKPNNEKPCLWCDLWWCPVTAAINPIHHYPDCKS